MKKRSKFLAMLLSTAVAVSSLTGISVFAADKTSGEEETRTVVDATGAVYRIFFKPGILFNPKAAAPPMAILARHQRHDTRMVGICGSRAVLNDS